MLLVVYVTMRFDHSHCYGHCRKNDVEALPKTYKQHVRIQNNSFNEKYGYMEICTRLLRKTLVENSVKESRGQPKRGALKQATCKGNF